MPKHRPGDIRIEADYEDVQKTYFWGCLISMILVVALGVTLAILVRV